MSVLTKLISQDFEITGNGRWLKTREHDSLVIDTEENIFFWNSRDIVGDATTWLVKVKGKSLNDARDILRDYEEYETVQVYTVRRRHHEIVVLPKLVEVFWKLGRKRRDYWYSRLLTDETINRFQLGWYNGWYTIPFFMDGTFRNFQVRRDQPSKQIKGWYRGVGPLLFNADLLKITRKVFVTEGVVDCILLNQMGIPAVSHNSGAEGWPKEWNKYFYDQNEVVIVYDNDVAGIKGAKKVAWELHAYKCKIFTFSFFPQRYDIIEYFRDGKTREDFLDLIDKESRLVFQI